MSSPIMTSKNFFDNVETQNLPSTAIKKQPWTEFHAPQENLAKTGNVECDVPTTKDTGMF